MLTRSVPRDLPLDTIELDLSYHSIKKLDPTNFRNCSNMTALFLHHGSLESIASGTFDDLTNLKYLSLFLNNLNYTRSSFPVNLFSPLTNLQTLHMDLQNKGNVYTMLQTWNLLDMEYIKHGTYKLQYIDHSFKDFKDIIEELPVSLKALKIDLNPWNVEYRSSDSCDESVYPILSRFVNLEKLWLHRTYPCHSVSANETFSSLAELPITHLTIKFLKLTNVAPLAFSWFKDLTYLSMSGTRGMSVADFYPAFIGLRKTKISKLVLSSFHQSMRNSETVVLHDEFFKYLALPYLTSLDLSNSNIRLPKWYSFHARLKYLRHLDLSKNNIAPWESDDRVTDFTENLPELRTLDLSSQSSSRSNTLRIHLSENMQKLDMSRFNSVREPINMRRIDLLNRNSLSEFIFSHNSLGSLDFLNIQVPNLKVALTLDLSDNRLTKITPRMLNSSLSKGLILGKLLLARNQLGKHIASNVEDTFSKFGDLRTLDLSYNEIKTLPKSAFSTLRKLEYLNLSGNFLDWIEFKMRHLTSLITVDLSNNRITRIGMEVHDELTVARLVSMKQKGAGIVTKTLINHSVNLTGNVLECSCETLSSLECFRLEKHQMFSHFNTYYCFQNNMRITFKHIDEIINQLNSRCNPFLSA